MSIPQTPRKLWSNRAIRGKLGPIKFEQENTKDVRTLTSPIPVSNTLEDDATQGGPPILVVDLDETLLRSDMLHETLWSTLSDNPKAIWGSLAALQNGKAALKTYLASQSEIDPATLPYEPRVLDKLKTWRADGGRTALVTASEAGLANGIAGHLDLFDEVHGTTPERNLKGQAKADFLAHRYGRGGYVYIGDSAADLPVWQGAAQAISIGAKPAVRQALDQTGVPAQHWDGASNVIVALRRATRPHQWLKNLLVLVPLVAGQMFDIGSFISIVLTFFALSLTASAGYVINDLLDLSDDRNHPRKRERPFASGALSPRIGTLLAPTLLVLGLSIGLMVSVQLAGVVIAYFVGTLAYSIKLKRHTMVDICMLAFLFTLRIIAGGVALQITLSVWLLAFSMFLFLSLAATKRLAELAKSETATREGSRRGYRPDDLIVISQISISSGYLAVLVLALYFNQPYIVANLQGAWLLWGMLPFLIFWVSRATLVAHRGEMDDDPMIWAMRNGTSRKVALMIAAILMTALIW